MIETASPESMWQRPRTWRLLVPAALLLLWVASYVAIRDDFILASPWATFAEVGEGIRKGWLIDSLRATVTRLLGAFALACAVGIPLAVLLGLGRTAHDVFEPFVIAGWIAPKSVMYPIFILVLGLGATSAIVFAASWGIFPLMTMVMHGIRRIPAVYFKLSRSLAVGPWRQFTKIIAPAISLELVVGLRYCFSLSFLGMIVIEMFGSRDGIGRDLIALQSKGDMRSMLAVVVVVVVLTTAISFGFYEIERRMLRVRRRSTDVAAQEAEISS